MSAAKRWSMCCILYSAAVIAPRVTLALQTPSSKSPAPVAAVAALRIRVLDENDSNIVAAEVVVKDAHNARTMRTDSAGDVALERVQPGVVNVALRRIGFGAASFDIRVEPGDNLFTVHLEGTTVELDELRIVGGRRFYGRLDDFEQRRARHSANDVITQSEIAKRHPIRLSQMLRAVSGIRLADSSGSIVAISTRGAQPVVSPGRGIAMLECVLRMAIDGIMRPPLTDLDSVQPNDVYGVEVFLGPARIPPQFGGMRGDTWCGLIAVWTRVN